VAQLLSIERAGLGRLVDHLEGRGLVRRNASAINRRYYVLYLTEAGTALLHRMRPAVIANDKALAAKIGSRAYKELQRALSIFLGDA
jgi:DNA-binding MarR family transcriptional regulator